MAITRRTDYAVRLMHELAQVPVGATLSIRDLCEVADVPENFGTSITAYLIDAGLVKSEGYNNHLLSLAAPAAQITMAQIIRASEPEFSLSTCVRDPKSCDRSGYCGAHMMWAELDAVIWQRLESVTLAEVATSRPTDHTAAHIPSSVTGLMGIA